MKNDDTSILPLARVIIIDDDADIARSLARIILYSDDKKENRLCRPTWVTNEEDFMHEFEVEEPDLVIIDLKLNEKIDPDSTKGGYSILQFIENNSNAASIIYSSQAEELDKNKALTHGADDYLTKPQEPELIIKRVHSLLTNRRIFSSSNSAGIIDNIGPWEFTTGNRYIKNVSGQSKRLSISEYKFLELAFASKNNFVPESIAYKEIFGEHKAYDSRLANLVYRLRKKLESEHLIISIRDNGYRLAKY